MTTILLYFYLIQKGANKLFAHLVTLFFGLVESVFFISSVTKFFHGGYVAVAMALVILSIMYVWERSNIIQQNAVDEVDLKEYLPQINSLRHDQDMDLYQTNVVFLVPQMEGDMIDKRYLYSILDKRPKRAKVYWFVNVEVTDEPYTKEYSVDMMGTDYIVKLKLYLGFRISQNINIYLRQVITELMAEGRLPMQPQKYTITPGRIVGDFRFILITEELSNMSNIDSWSRQVMQAKLFIKRHTMSPESWFGLVYSDVTYETVPLQIGTTRRSILLERKSK